jgi:hypothetical protein
MLEEILHEEFITPRKFTVQPSSGGADLPD